MTIVITRKTYDRVVRLCPRPRTPNPRHLSADLVILSIPDVLADELHNIHPHTEEAICRLLEVEQ